MLSVLKRAPHDDFTFKIFYKLIKKVKHPMDAIYIWAPVLVTDLIDIIDETGKQQFCDSELYYRGQLFKSINEKLVVLAIKDHLTHKQFNPWIDTKPDLVCYLEQLFEFYQDKQFILITSLENLESYIQNKNVKIMSWGGDITNQEYQYKKLLPVLEKNFDSQSNFISLNRNARSHRLLLVSMLYGMNLQDSGLISYISQHSTGNVDSINWTFTADQTGIKNIADLGFEIFKNSELEIKDDADIYGKANNNTNVENFLNKLQHYYKNTFVEIVSETSYTESAFLITEKFLNSVYGCNFPILLCSKGSIEFLRNVGFDMFDDIVDNSHDLIDNPIDRMYSAICNNYKLLSDNSYTKDLWLKNKHRFISNVDVAKTKMYKFYNVRTETELENCLNDIQN